MKANEIVVNMIALYGGRACRTDAFAEASLSSSSLWG